MTALTPFLFEDEHLVRTMLRADDPWFVLADVCRVLEIDQPHHAAARLDDDEKGRDTITTPGGAQEMTIINESGLYSLILTSRKPAAKRFKKWVTSEVLPSIRKTGGYSVGATKINPTVNRHALDLMERLKRETNPSIRRSVHDMLTAACQQIGIATPPLNAIGQDAPPPPDLLAPFWTAIAALEAQGVAVNHAADPALIAINLTELAKHAAAGRLVVPVDGALRRALRQSTAPAFLHPKTIRSRLTGIPVVAELSHHAR